MISDFTPTICPEFDVDILLTDTRPDTLIISKRHIASYFELDDSEKTSLINILDKQKKKLKLLYGNRQKKTLL